MIWPFQQSREQVLVRFRRYVGGPELTERRPGIGPCTPWTGARGSAVKYGQLKVDNKAKLAHRVAWSLAGKDVPLGLRVLHKCDNPVCVRIDHLFLGTDADNAADRCMKGRSGKSPLKSMGVAWLGAASRPRFRAPNKS